MEGWKAAVHEELPPLVAAMRTLARARPCSNMQTSILCGHCLCCRPRQVMFQMMVNTAHPAFKAVSAICKEERPEQLPAN